MIFLFIDADSEQKKERNRKGGVIEIVDNGSSWYSLMTIVEDFFVVVVG